MDPGGREMVIACGAALVNVRVAAFLQVIDSSEKVETVTDLVRSAEQADRAATRRWWCVSVTPGSSGPSHAARRQRW